MQDGAGLGRIGPEHVRPNWVRMIPKGQTQLGRMGPEGVKSNWAGWDPAGSD